MTPEAKIRTAAQLNSTLTGYLGAPGNTFRFYDMQLPQGAIKAGTCMRMQRISTMRQYAFDGLQNVSWPRFQFDIYDPDPEVARAVGLAFIDWLGTVSFGNIGTQYANFLLNQRSGMNYELAPPVYVQTLDVRIFNLEG